MKKSLTPDELERLYSLLEKLQTELAGLMRFVESKLAQKPS
jgi:hypothetical protein